MFVYSVYLCLCVWTRLCRLLRLNAKKVNLKLFFKQQTYIHNFFISFQAEFVHLTGVSGNLYY